MQTDPKVPEDVRKLARLRFFRDLTVGQRMNVWRALIGPEAAEEVNSHTRERMIFDRYIMADRATRPDAAGIAADMVRYRHKKRGTEYVLLGYGKMQAENWLEPADDGNGSASVDMREVAIYRSVDDGSLWVRPREEFEDGRFELVPAAPAIKADGEKL